MPWDTSGEQTARNKTPFRVTLLHYGHSQRGNFRAGEAICTEAQPAAGHVCNKIYTMHHSLRSDTNKTEWRVLISGLPADVPSVTSGLGIAPTAGMDGDRPVTSRRALLATPGHAPREGRGIRGGAVRGWR